MLHTEVIWELYPWKTEGKSKNQQEANFIKFLHEHTYCQYFYLGKQKKTPPNLYFKWNSYKKWRPIISENEIVKHRQNTINCNDSYLLWIPSTILSSALWICFFQYDHLATESFLEFTHPDHACVPQGTKGREVLLSLSLLNSGGRMTRG